MRSTLFIISFRYISKITVTCTSKRKKINNRINILINYYIVLTSRKPKQLNEYVKVRGLLIVAYMVYR